MPQMSPMDWFMLSLFFLLVYFMGLMYMYFLMNMNFKMVIVSKNDFNFIMNI